MSTERARNSPCWCGSGKKLKHCHRQSRQERRQALTLDFGRPVAPTGIQFDLDFGRVRFLDDRYRPITPEAAWLISEYARPKGPKVINHVPQDAEAPLSATLGSALLRYDRLYLLDTNSCETLSERVAVTAVYYGQLRRLDVATSMLALSFVGMLEFHGVRRINPERLGWSTLIQIVRSAPDYDVRWRVGLFVDSELDRHASLNARSEPLYDDFYLPVNFRLMYASDSGSDSAFNKVMRNADKLARDVLAGVRRGVVPDVHIRPVAAQHLCRGLRVWSRVANDERVQTEMVPFGTALDSRMRVLRPAGRTGPMHVIQF